MSATEVLEQLFNDVDRERESQHKAPFVKSHRVDTEDLVADGNVENYAVKEH